MEIPENVVTAFPKPAFADEAKLALLYFQKAQSANRRGLDFTISFSEYKRLMARKSCYYTGISMTRCQGKGAENWRPTDRTLDRVDGSLGYVPGNVVSCSRAANALKARWEHPDCSPISPKQAERMMRKVGELMGGKNAK